MKFMIVTKTSAAHGSGADTALKLTLHGEKSSVGPVSLNNFLENFEPGMIDCHFFSGEDIGAISSIQLETPESYSLDYALVVPHPDDVKLRYKLNPDESFVESLIPAVGKTADGFGNIEAFPSLDQTASQSDLESYFGSGHYNFAVFTFERHGTMGKGDAAVIFAKNWIKEMSVIDGPTTTVPYGADMVFGHNGTGDALPYSETLSASDAATKGSSHGSESGSSTTLKATSEASGMGIKVSAEASHTIEQKKTELENEARTREASASTTVSGMAPKGAYYASIRGWDETQLKTTLKHGFSEMNVIHPVKFTLSITIDEMDVDLAKLVGKIPKIWWPMLTDKIKAAGYDLPASLMPMQAK